MLKLPVSKEEIVKAVDEAKKSSLKRGFIQSIDLLLTLKEIDLKRPENRINEIIELPNSIGKEVKISIFATGNLAVRANATSVDQIFSSEDLDRFARDKKSAKKIAKETDFFIAEAPLMPQIARSLGPILGPRGKMPTPIPPTAQIENIIERYKRMVRVRVRDQMNAQCRVGTEDVSNDDLAENIIAVITRLESTLPKGLANIRAAYVKTTMGSPIKMRL
jgi:large subunit ribosomal protein L1